MKRERNSLRERNGKRAVFPTHDEHASLLDSPEHTNAKRVSCLFTILSLLFHTTYILYYL